MTVQIVITGGGEELAFLPRAEYDALLARARDEGAPAETAPPQAITITNEELVMISRRDYDVLLAWNGDEEAEDRLLSEKVREVLGRIERGEEKLVPPPDSFRRIASKLTRGN